MHNRLLSAVTLSLFTLVSGPLSAGPETVAFPENYSEDYLNYLDVDHLERKRVRKMYVNRETHEMAVAGGPLPDGTILIMEDHDARTDAYGDLVRDTDGRLIALDPVTNIFVMEKNASWNTDNETWDYAWYLPDGTPRPDVQFDGCFACHASRSERDYTFTYWKFVSDLADR